ncbi:glutamate receptor [Senna tora]|uniref:Glutamate receptor n=1 Tax=Senna tora TaxID=362788 RepID=A0A834T3I6_9FABA|nr:glutamate receptor [Senna tora]
MASSPSSVSSTSTVVVPTNAAAKTYSLFSSSSQISTIKLDRGNYLVWEYVILPLIEGNRLDSHINGLGVIPPRLITAEKEVTPNPAFEEWTANNTNQSSWRGSRGRGRGGRGRGGRGGRGFFNGTNNSSNRPYCHLCEKPGFLNRRTNLLEQDFIVPLVIDIGGIQHTVTASTHRPETTVTNRVNEEAALMGMTPTDMSVSSHFDEAREQTCDKSNLNQFLDSSSGNGSRSESSIGLRSKSSSKLNDLESSSTTVFSQDSTSELVH